jgi:hypothetical protein
MEAHLTQQDLRSIKERVEKATPGPWCVAGSDRDYVIAKHGDSERSSDNPILWADEDCLEGKKEDAEFIAQARTDVPQLVEEVYRLRAMMQGILNWQFGRSFWSGIHRKRPDPALAQEILSLFPAEELPARLPRLLIRGS